MKSRISEYCFFPKDKISISDLALEDYVSTECMIPNKGGICLCSCLPSEGKVKAFKKGDVLLSNIRIYFKKVWLADRDGGCSNDVLVFRAKDNCDPDFLYSILSSDDFLSYASATSKGTKMPRGDKDALMKYEACFFNLQEQRKIGSFVTVINRLIKSNNRINDNLSKQAMAIYQKMFTGCSLPVKPLDELFNISIGKTPPRKEFEWFSDNEGIKWVSIANLGSCGTYISETTERLTDEAVKRFNVPVVEANTVLLSFKLTMGRVAITDTTMCTNEAIASFNDEKLPLTFYLYCFLKDFKFQTLGSTSSIATAVNSKIIKKIPLPVPLHIELEKFNSLVAPLFEQIRNLERENKRLSETRDILMSKLLTGEV